jgi:hypothetical protein
MICLIAQFAFAEDEVYDFEFSESGFYQPHSTSFYIVIKNVPIDRETNLFELSYNILGLTASSTVAIFTQYTSYTIGDSTIQDSVAKNTTLTIGDYNNVYGNALSLKFPVLPESAVLSSYQIAVTIPHITGMDLEKLSLFFKLQPLEEDGASKGNGLIMKDMYYIKTKTPTLVNEFNVNLKKYTGKEKFLDSDILRQFSFEMLQFDKSLEGDKFAGAFMNLNLNTTHAVARPFKDREATSCDGVITLADKTVIKTEVWILLLDFAISGFTIKQNKELKVPETVPVGGSVEVICSNFALDLPSASPPVTFQLQYEPAQAKYMNTYSVKVDDKGNLIIAAVVISVIVVIGAIVIGYFVWKSNQKKKDPLLGVNSSD